MTYHVFTAELWEHDPGAPGSWHFITLPVEVADEIEVESGPREGFGSVRVEVRVGRSTWETSLFPDAKAGSFVLPVKKQVLMAEGIEAGDSCDVTLRLT